MHFKFLIKKFKVGTQSEVPGWALRGARHLIIFIISKGVWGHHKG